MKIQGFTARGRLRKGVTYKMEHARAACSTRNGQNPLGTPLDVSFDIDGDREGEDARITIGLSEFKAIIAGFRSHGLKVWYQE